MPSRILVPIIVACALFMENLDATALATSLPAIARDLNEDPIAVKLALTSYLLSLAVFIPVSGWIADRFGARDVFRIAIGIFMVGSIACGFASGLADFVVARIIQGMGAAMMTPVGRLVILRSVPKGELVSALAWFTIPAIVGPIMGPPLGGFITTYFSWRWIFFINIPFGILGIILATRFIGDFRERHMPPLDGRGLVLLAIGLSGLVFGLAILGQHPVPIWLALGVAAVGAVFCWLYVRHARRTTHPVLNLQLLGIATFRASVFGGATFRIAAGASSFLLPLMFQISFGLTAFQSGLLTFALAIGAFTMKFAAAPILRHYGFRRVLTLNAVLSSAFVCAYALFTPSTPHLAILTVLLVGGFFRSLQFTAINSIGYADIAAPNMSQATSFASAGHQLSLSLGVAAAAIVLEAAQLIRGDNAILLGDFVTAYLIVGIIGALSAFIFATLAPDAGAELTSGAAQTQHEETGPPEGPQSGAQAPL
jgi:EmrB/QacA subfamily drug resistance transporter